MIHDLGISTRGPQRTCKLTGARGYSGTAHRRAVVCKQVTIRSCQSSVGTQSGTRAHGQAWVVAADTAVLSANQISPQEFCMPRMLTVS